MKKCIVMTIMIFLGPWIAMLVWNWLMPLIFGLITLTYWQMFCLSFLTDYLFKTTNWSVLDDKE